MKNIIIITDKNSCMINTKEELIELFLGYDYFTLTNEKRKERLLEKASLYSFNNINLVKLNDNYNKKDPYILIDNEINFILSLLKLNNIIILENRNSNVFIKDFMKDDTTDNYFIINNYIDKILYGGNNVNN